MAPMPRPTQKVGQRRSRTVFQKTLRSSMGRLLARGRTARSVASSLAQSLTRSVVGHEDLLEARFDAPQVADLEPRGGLHESVEAAHDRAPESLPVDGQVPHAGQARERLDRDLVPEIDLEPAQGPFLQRGDRLDREQST